MTFKFNDFGIDEEALKPIRHELYHTDGAGYVILPQFVTEQFVAHYRSVWTEVENHYLHEPFESWGKLTVGGPNLERNVPGASRLFVNFFWNPPLDDVAHTVSLYITVLRNRIEAKPATAEIFPNSSSKKPQRCVSFRVVNTLNQSVGAPPHRDWLEPDSYDLGRLQATLFLSTPGVDFDGDGFVFTSNGGRRLVFGKDVEIKAGDLVLWRYNNQHAVMNISSKAGQLGFLRVLHPPELLDGIEAPKNDANKSGGGAPEFRTKKSIWNRPADETSAPSERTDTVAPHTDAAAQTTPPQAKTEQAPSMKERLKQTSLGRKVLVPAYRRLRTLR